MCKSFFRRHKKKIIIGGCVIAAAGVGTGIYIAVKHNAVGEVASHIVHH